MKGDFSRDSFDPKRHAYRVLMQQGRVQLDADWNEQAAIMLHRLEMMTRDTFGPFGGPQDACGFALFHCEDQQGSDLGIGAGRYYVDGLLIENDEPRRYREVDGAALEGGCAYILYLHAWEEFVAPQQDSALVDPALDGLDTAARTRLEWRVRALKVDELPQRHAIAAGWPHDFLEPRRAGPRGRLAASVAAQAAAFDSAVALNASGYHGSENRLYRVEIHDPGTAQFGATFKWSRDNGAISFAIASVADKVVTLEGFGRDAHAKVAPGDWVEICDDDDAGADKPARGLFAVAHADQAARAVTLKTASGYVYHPQKHPILRRWDQHMWPNKVAESSADDDFWTPLEDGVAIRFAAARPGRTEPVYRTGDYWMIPARTAGGGELLWPSDRAGQPAFREPAGIRHRYAPLAGISVSTSGEITIDPTNGDYRTFISSPSGMAAGLPCPHCFTNNPRWEQRCRSCWLLLDTAGGGVRPPAAGQTRAVELTPDAQPATRARSPLTALPGIELAQVRALAEADVHTLEHVAQSMPAKIAHALSAWTHIDPEALIAQAKHLLHLDNINARVTTVAGGTPLDRQSSAPDSAGVRDWWSDR
jgi:hypothetical protein